MTRPPAVISHEDQLRAKRATLDPYPEGRFAGDGIVVCAGGASIFTNAYVLVHVLRHHLGCALPIEVWHFGEAEISARMRVVLKALGADAIDADAVLVGRGLAFQDGWQLKGFALAESRFRHVLLLDADVVPERDPAEVFAWPEFAASGAVLWPDVCWLAAENPIWAACGLPPRRMRAVESGQMVIDKARHWHALQLIVHLNTQADHYYRMVYGDKDLFLIGLLLADSRHDLVPHAPHTDAPWCLYQRDFRGERLFQHRTGAKWRYRGLQEEVPGFRHGDACERALDALRSSWNGHVFNAPARSPSARAEEGRLATTRSARLVRVGETPCPCELLDGGEFKAHRPSFFSQWFCAGDDPIHLVLRDRYDCDVRFTLTAPGRWLEVGVPDHLAAVLFETSGALHPEWRTLRSWLPNGLYEPDDTRPCSDPES